MHLSQSIGAGALDGQHGMSPVISSATADIDISLGIVDVERPEGTAAMTGRDSGANANPAIIRIASSRRMANWRFTPQNPTDAEKLKASRANDVVIIRLSP